MQEIHHVCSLGSLCHSSQILKRNKFKKCSYPFDWIFSSSDNIIHCIEDDFNIFLDKSYYVNVSETQCGHSKYHYSMFNHHNPLTNIDHYRYFTRCVARFKMLLKAKDHKLFTMVVRDCISSDDEGWICNFFTWTQEPTLKVNETAVFNILEFNTKLSKYTSNYTLLVIFPVCNTKRNHHFTYSGNVHFLELHTISTSDGVEFLDKNDNIYLDNIIKSKYIFL